MLLSKKMLEIRRNSDNSLYGHVERIADVLGPIKKKNEKTRTNVLYVRTYMYVRVRKIQSRRFNKFVAVCYVIKGDAAYFTM